MAKIAYAKHNDRRAYEWKVTLGIWAVILASIVQDLPLPLWAWIILVLFYAFFWLSPVWAANNDNKLWHDHYMRAAANLLINPYASIGKPPVRLRGPKRYFGFLIDWAMAFQFCATLLLALSAFFYV